MYKEKDPMETSLSKMFTVVQASKMTKVRPERLVDLARAGFAPHIMIDGRGPFFRKDIVHWVKTNLLNQSAGQDLPVHLKVMIESPKAGFADVPDSLLPMVDKIREYCTTADFPCVYFLVKDLSVIYVGKTINLNQRMVEHSRTKAFDKIFYIRVPGEELANIEAAFIRTLKPSLNHDANFEVHSRHIQILNTIGANHLIPSEVTA